MEKENPVTSGDGKRGIDLHPRNPVTSKADGMSESTESQILRAELEARGYEYKGSERSGLSQ